jgi:hypothetical protein
MRTLSVLFCEENIPQIHRIVQRFEQAEVAHTIHRVHQNGDERALLRAHEGKLPHATRGSDELVYLGTH